MGNVINPVVNFNKMLEGDTAIVEKKKSMEQEPQTDDGEREICKREDAMNGRSGRYMRQMADALVIEVAADTEVDPDDKEKAEALTLVQGVYYKIGTDPAGRPVFRQEARDGGRELFIYKVTSRYHVALTAFGFIVQIISNLT